MERPTIISLVLVEFLTGSACSQSEPARAPAETYLPMPSMTPACAPAVRSAAPRQVEIESKLESDLPTHCQISVSKPLKDACAMSDEDAYFPFDFAEITERDERVARRLANCFDGGPLNGKVMRLIGHADPRGSEGHNLLLGQRRANKVKEFLVHRGIPADRIVASSRGKADAKGYDETTWALDRLVEISGGD